MNDPTHDDAFGLPNGEAPCPDIEGTGLSACHEAGTNREVPARTEHEVRHTIASEPPTTAPRARDNQRVWEPRLQDAREYAGEWRRLVDPMSKSTAVQVASDVRNGHKPGRTVSRVTGIEPTDRFQTVAAHDPIDPDPAHWYIWLNWSEAPPVADEVDASTEGGEA